MTLAELMIKANQHENNETEESSVFNSSFFPNGAIKKEQNEKVQRIKATPISRACAVSSNYTLQNVSSRD